MEYRYKNSKFNRIKQDQVLPGTIILVVEREAEEDKIWEWGTVYKIIDIIPDTKELTLDGPGFSALELVATVKRVSSVWLFSKSLSYVTVEELVFETDNPDYTRYMELTKEFPYSWIDADNAFLGGIFLLKKPFIIDSRYTNTTKKEHVLDGPVIAKFQPEGNDFLIDEVSYHTTTPHVLWGRAKASKDLLE